MELELGLALPIPAPMMIEKGCNEYIHHREPRFVDHSGKEEEEEEEVESKGSSLLLWSGQPNEDDHRKWSKIHVVENGIDNGEEVRGIVGWPPINSLRKELLHRHQGGGWMAYNHRAAAARGFPVMRNSVYVKVKMAGVAIARKIDLRRYDSYQALRATLVNMFAKHTKNGSRDGEYTILYQDKEGYWLQAGDVPWQTFVESVQRMEIQRNAN